MLQVRVRVLYSYHKFEYELCTNTTSSSTSFVLILQVGVRVLYSYYKFEYEFCTNSTNSSTSFVISFI